MNGAFITFEGADGVGKSTQVNRTQKRLEKKGYKILKTREPGGTIGAEAIREILLSGVAEPFGGNMEAILFAAARADHVRQTIKPALENGYIILCDRFMDSSRVYQGITKGVDKKFILKMEKAVVEDIVPSLTIIFDLDTKLAKLRMKKRKLDRFEKENEKQHENRRKEFLKIASEEKNRCIVVNAGQKINKVSLKVDEVIDKHIKAIGYG